MGKLVTLLRRRLPDYSNALLDNLLPRLIANVTAVAVGCALIKSDQKEQDIMTEEREIKKEARDRGAEEREIMREAREIRLMLLEQEREKREIERAINDREAQQLQKQKQIRERAHERREELRESRQNSQYQLQLEKHARQRHMHLDDTKRTDADTQSLNDLRSMLTSITNKSRASSIRPDTPEVKVPKQALSHDDRTKEEVAQDLEFKAHLRRLREQPDVEPWQSNHGDRTKKEVAHDLEFKAHLRRLREQPEYYYSELSRKKRGKEMGPVSTSPLPTSPLPTSPLLEPDLPGSMAQRHVGLCEALSLQQRQAKKSRDQFEIEY